MDSNVGGAVVKPFSSGSFSGKFSSGWEKQYFSNPDPQAHTSVATENFSFDSIDQSTFDSNTTVTYKKNPETFFTKTISNSVFKPGVDSAIKAGLKKMDEFLLAHLSAPGAVISSGVSNLVAAPVLSGLTKFFKNYLEGEDLGKDVFKEMNKTAAKNIPKYGLTLLTIGGTSIYGGFSKWSESAFAGLDIENDIGFSLEQSKSTPFNKYIKTDPVKMLKDLVTKDVDKVAKDYVAEMSNVKSLKNTREAIVKELYNGNEKEAAKSTAVKSIDKQMKQIEQAQIMFERLGGSTDKVGMARGLHYAGAFAKNYGTGMAIQTGADTLLAIGGNILKSVVVDGKSWKEAFSADNAKYGEEFLKASWKTVFTVSGELIGGAFGFPEIGKKIGGIVGGFVGELSVKPFQHQKLDENGNPMFDEYGNPIMETEQGWCAIAGGATLAGGILGGCVAAFIVSNPVGWAVGVGILVGAAVGYGITVLVRHWDDVVEWAEETWADIEETAEVVIDWCEDRLEDIETGEWAEWDVWFWNWGW